MSILHDRRTGQTLRASRDSGGDWMEYSRAPSLDASGGILVLVTRHPIDDRDDGYDEDLVVSTHAVAGSASKVGPAHTPPEERPTQPSTGVRSARRTVSCCDASENRQ